ncbi:hypothetical protein ACFL6G_08620 [candidate division KSB1 bacterium]
MIKRSIYSILILLALIISNPVFAQPGPPGPPVGLVPWGNPILYAGFVILFGAYFLWRRRKEENKN